MVRDFQVSCSNSVFKDLSNSSGIQTYSIKKKEAYLELPKPTSQKAPRYCLSVFNFFIILVQYNQCFLNSRAMFLLVQVHLKCKKYQCLNDDVTDISKSSVKENSSMVRK